MPFTVETNRIYAERCKNLAVAMQNLAEEAARLRTVYVQEMQSNPAEFADTDIASKAEITTFQSYLTELLTFHNGGGALSDTARGTAWALPLIHETPA